MGHKWLWNESLGGFPPESFFAGLDPALGSARQRMSGRFARSCDIAGTLSTEWANRLGLSAGIPLPVAALDAHWDAIGAGASNWVGPIIVWLFMPLVGVAGVMWIYAVLYILSAILTMALTLPQDAPAAEVS
jgi:ribulose kinase